MNWNKNGKNARKLTRDASSKVYGIIEAPKSQYLETPENAEPVESVYRYEQREKILREIEAKTSRAVVSFRRFQNC